MEEKIIYTYCLMLEEEKVIGFNKAFGIPYETETEIVGWFTEDGIAKYKYVDGEVVERTEEEIEADRVEVVEEPTQLDRIESQVLYTALMTDTLIESEV